MAPGVTGALSEQDRVAARERAFRLLAVTVSALFLAFATLGGAFLWYDHAEKWVEHTRLVRTGIADVLQGLTDAESAERAYLLTHQEPYVGAVDAARRRAEGTLDALDGQIRDNPEQQQRLGALRVRAAERLAIIDSVIIHSRANDQAGALAIIQTGRGAAAMAAVRRLVGEFDQAEARLEAQRAGRSRAIKILIGATLPGFALLLSLMFVKAVRDINLDRELATDLSQRLEGLLHERTLLTHEVNHRVKNSLQQIASVIRLQSRGADNPDTSEALDKALFRIMAVGRVHEQLYRPGEALGAFDAGLYARTLAQELVSAMGREDVRLETHIAPAPLELRQATPLALILNELMTNALKYGCLGGRQSVVQVKLEAEGEDYRLTVADDGPGVPPGFKPAESRGLGMRAVDALCRQLGGRLEVEQPATGASFAVVFPQRSV